MNDDVKHKRKISRWEYIHAWIQVYMIGVSPSYIIKCDFLNKLNPIEIIKNYRKDLSDI